MSQPLSKKVKKIEEGKEDKENPPTPQGGKPPTKNNEPTNQHNAPTTITFPPQLNTQRFSEAWQRWTQYRKERKLPLTPSTIKAQLNKLSELGETQAISRIDLAIANSWRGVVFANDSKPPTTPQRKHPCLDSFIRRRLGEQAFFPAKYEPDYEAWLKEQPPLNTGAQP